MTPSSDSLQNKTSYRELFLIFLKLGTFAFGGPAAHVAMMEKEFVEKRQWLSQDEFLAYLGFTNLIPGPNSTEMALHIGYSRRKGIGLLVAGISFIFPAFIMVLILSELLIRYGTLPGIEKALSAVLPIMVGLILSVIVKFAKPLVKSPSDWLLLGLITIGAFLMNELALLVITGIVVTLIKKKRIYVIEPISLLSLFLIFLKIGAILYGSGYVLLAYLKTEFLDVRQILTLKQIMDALAIGQLTPGPVFTTATAIGYLIHGWVGGLVATIGIFLPAFILVQVLNPLFKKLSTNTSLTWFLHGLKLASLALMIKVVLEITAQTWGQWTVILIPISAVLLLKTKINPTTLILGGVGLGLILSLI